MVKLELFGRTRIFSSEVPESLTVGASLNIHGLFFLLTISFLWQLYWQALCSHSPYFVAVSTLDAKTTPQVNL